MDRGPSLVQGQGPWSGPGTGGSSLVQGQGHAYPVPRWTEPLPYSNMDRTLTLFQDGQTPLPYSKMDRDPYPVPRWTETLTLFQDGQNPYPIPRWTDPYPVPRWTATLTLFQDGQTPLPCSKMDRHPYPVPRWTETLTLFQGRQEPLPSSNAHLLGCKPLSYLFIVDKGKAEGRQVKGRCFKVIQSVRIHHS